MKTAEEIANKYADLNGVNQMDLELDILMYLEHHRKSWVEHSIPERANPDDKASKHKYVMKPLTDSDLHWAFYI